MIMLKPFIFSKILWGWGIRCFSNHGVSLVSNSKADSFFFFWVLCYFTKHPGIESSRIIHNTEDSHRLGKQAPAPGTKTTGA